MQTIWCLHTIHNFSIFMLITLELKVDLVLVCMIPKNQINAKLINALLLLRTSKDVHLCWVSPHGLGLSPHES